MMALKEFLLDIALLHCEETAELLSNEAKDDTCFQHGFKMGVESGLNYKIYISYFFWGGGIWKCCIRCPARITIHELQYTNFIQYVIMK